MKEIRKAVREGRRACSFFDELAGVARGWAGDINGTQAYVLVGIFARVAEDTVSSAKGGVGAMCIGSVF